MTQFRVWALLLLSFALLPWSASEARIRQRTAESQEIPLSTLLSSRKSGLQIEERNHGRWKQLRQQASAFIRMRRGKMTPREKTAWLSNCFEKSPPAVFCEFKVDKDSPTAPPLTLMQDPEIRSASVTDSILNGELDELRGVDESTFHRSLRYFPNWDTLEPIAKKVRSEKSCQTVAMTMALGQKAEEYFPDQKFKDIALSFYEQAASCENEPAIAQKALYRHSLVRIWDNQCDGAEAALIRLSADRNGDYASRALYWRFYCANKKNDPKTAAELKDLLIRDYPLSYHGLLASRGESRGSMPAPRQDVGRAEPKALLRSAVQPELNIKVRAAELLHSLDAHDLARDVLDSVQLGLNEKSEPGFKLYVAVLAGRSGDMISQFRLLSLLFRENPEMIARGTLEMFYPLERFAMIEKHRQRVDPLLVAALIRQESAFNPNARSPAGALGLMQLMPDTARRIERRISKKKLLDPTTNIRLGVKHFHQLLARYEADAELALAAYNAGSEKVDDWRRRYPTQNRTLFLDLIPFPETRNYVVLIARNYFWYLSLYAAQRGPASTKKLAVHRSGKGPHRPVKLSIFTESL